MALSSVAAKNLPGGAMPRRERQLLDLFQRHRGNVVTADDLIGALYPNPDDEPDSAQSNAMVYLHRLRRRFGVRIETVRGWRLPK